jgi:hypothetical protein
MSEVTMNNVALMHPDTGLLAQYSINAHKEGTAIMNAQRHKQQQMNTDSNTDIECTENIYFQCTLHNYCTHTTTCHSVTPLCTKQDVKPE